MGRRGYYRLNTNGSADARQLMLNFKEEQQNKPSEDADETKKEDRSLCLFDFTE
jgi:hypothetical protein